MILAQGLEQPRTHVFSQDSAEQTECEPPGSVARTGADPQCHLGRLSGLGEEPKPWSGMLGGGPLEGGPRALREMPRKCRDSFDNFFVLEPARCRDQGSTANIVPPLEFDQLGPGHSIEGRGSSGERSAEWLPRPERFIEQLLDVVLRL